MVLLFSVRVAESPPVWERAAYCVTVRIFRERLSIFVCDSSLFGFEGGIWGLIVLVTDHCLLLLEHIISLQE